LESGTPALEGRLEAALEFWRADPEALEMRWLGLLDPRDLEPGPRLRVVAEGEGDVDDLVEALEAGFPEVEIEALAAGRAQLLVSLPELEALARAGFLTRVRVPMRPALPAEGRRPGSPSSKAGGVLTEGYAAMFRRDWHAEGLLGGGMRIAVLDVGFAGYRDRLGDELPAEVHTSFRSPYTASEHGTAVAEVLHDIAPDAALDLYTFSTDVEFEDALTEIASTDADIVNGSIGFDNVWPTDGSSPMTLAVDALVEDSDIPYVAAAGNENDKYRVGTLGVEADGQVQRVTVDGLSEIWCATWGGIAEVSFRWDDPIGRSANDIDLYVYDANGNVCGSSTERQSGRGYPYESVSCRAGTNWAVAIPVLRGGDVAGLTGFLYSPNGVRVTQLSGERNLTLPADTRRGVSVGAVEVTQTDVISYYSSRGPTDDGRQKPDLVAPSGVSTSVYGQGAFLGTSASTPHATGVATLALEASRGDFDAGELLEWMRGASVDIGDEGSDAVSGAGFLSPSRIPWGSCGCEAGPALGKNGFLSRSLLPLLGLAALLQRKRNVGGGRRRKEPLP
jgi:hypothetical protein